jgi:hypothetical protein
VAFRGTGFLTASGAPQLVYLKVDDAGDAGIGPYRAAADGTVRGTLWLGAPGLPAAVGRPGTHWLRFLAGPSGAHPENGPPRSLTATFRLAEASVRPAASTLTTDGVAATLRLRATRRATGTVRLRRTNGAATLARASFSLSGRGTVALRVPLTAAGRRAVESDARLAVRLRITPTGGASTLHSASLRTR